MSDIFTAKIKYLKQLENGSIASKSEVYTLNALSFTEAEARLTGVLSEYIPEFNLLSLSKLNVQDVVIDEAKTAFYKVKVSFISADPDSGKEKKISEFYLVQADSTEEAHEKIKVRMEGSIMDYEIPSVSKTNVVDFFPYVD